MPHRVSPRAETDLDDIRVYVAKDSGSIEDDDVLILRVERSSLRRADAQPVKAQAQQALVETEFSGLGRRGRIVQLEHQP